MRRQPHAYFELLGIIDRREFFKTALAASAIVATLKLHAQTGAKDPLRTLADNLLADWCNGLRNLQIKSGPKDRLGGIKCPACDFIHGKIGDAVYPFLCVAKRHKDSDMLDSGIMLYDWMENNVSQADGAWDNSWGTRNFKWTYWGSRTSDGRQAGFAALADRDSRFYTAALKNLELLSTCTHGGLLYGGPHFRAHGQPPCIHHTFAPVKPLAALLDSEVKAPQSPAKLPRESAYGVKCFEDIRTYLAAKGPYRATVTGYDTEYYDLRNGHATGGALSMLWHEKAGPIFTAGMTEYAVIEKPNMQSDKGLDTMPLAPRAELECGGVKYRNVSDLSASLSHRESGGASVFEAVSVLRDADQKTPPSGEAKCRAIYEISADSAVLKYSSESELCKSAKIFFPLISESGEKFSLESPTSAELKKKNCTVRITSDKPIKVLPTKSGRIFNFVPGFEAVPLYVEGCNAMIKIEVV